MAKHPFGEPVILEVAGHDVQVTNPGKPYFPEHPAGPISKLEVVQYYVEVGSAMMTALRDRPTTLERWPGGVIPGARLSTRDGFKGEAFYQKRVPTGAPPWVKTARIAFPSGRTADEIAPDHPAVIAWAAQLGTITFHPWPVRAADVDHPDELRIDLDPQPGTDFSDSVTVALELRELLAELGWIGYPKTSGGRGVHVYVRVEPLWTFTDLRHAAIAIGRELERRLPGQVTTAWWKEERGEKVFVDYNQNARDRTIRSAWSLRAQPNATVSAPVTWDELPAVAPGDFTIRTVPARLAELGDPHAAIDARAFDLTPVLEWYARDERDQGLGDLPYPPEYPKMPGEPKRVQPSRARDS
ncbi:MAG: DNA polymerase domain-containing protein [Candidatus Nanopelagicales bacterium]